MAMQMSPPATRRLDGVTCVSDCDDDDASIAPGAFDQPGDGGGQDCSGGDANYWYIGNYSVDNDATASALCSYYDVVYGDLSINVSNISITTPML